MLTVLLTFLLLGVIIAAFLGVAVLRGRQMGALARNGMAIKGVVVRKFRSGMAGGAGSRGRRIAFTYTGPDGIAYRRAASLGIGKFSEFEEGSAIDLVCLPDNPGVSAPAWLVQQAREALART